MALMCVIMAQQAVPPIVMEPIWLAGYPGFLAKAAITRKVGPRPIVTDYMSFRTTKNLARVAMGKITKEGFSDLLVTMPIVTRLIRIRRVGLK